MKKLIVLAVATAIVMTSCSKDNEDSSEKFTKSETEVLSVLNGTFEGEEYSLGMLYRTDNMTFTPFNEPVVKTGFTDGNVSMFGTIHRIQDKAVGGRIVDYYYFHLDTSRSLLVLYGYNTDSGELNEKKETLRYSIESITTIKLVRYGLSDDNWIEYTRK